MRLYEGLIPTIARDLVAALIDAEFIEVEPQDVPEVELDAQAVLREYVRMDRELSDAARDIAAEQGSYGNHFKIKRRLAREKNFKLGDDALEYLIRQLIETFLHSNFVVEVFGDDRDLRRTMAPVFKKHMNTETELDKEVRSKIKNLEEGSRTWDIEYQKVMERLKQSKKLE